MKLDKIRFAQVVGFIQRQFAITFNTNELCELDNIINIDMPTPDVAHPAASDINALMALMAEGKFKIDAIKMHRKLTGYGLKESKEAVEEHWRAKPVEKEGATLGDILGNAQTKQRPPVNFDKFEG